MKSLSWLRISLTAGKLYNLDLNLHISFSDTKAPQFPELFTPGSGSKKKKGTNKNKSAFQPLKNPCLALNELKPGLEYKLLEQSGPVHMPKFKISIELDGQTFTGEGR